MGFPSRHYVIHYPLYIWGASGGIPPSQKTAPLSLPHPLFPLPSTCLSSGPLCMGISISRVWRTRLWLWCNAVCTPRACLPVSEPVFPICTKAILVTQLPLTAVVWWTTPGAGLYCTPKHFPLRQASACSKWDVPALYLRILAGLGAATPPAPLATAVSHSSSGSGSWLPRVSGSQCAKCFQCPSAREKSSLGWQLGRARAGAGRSLALCREHIRLALPGPSNTGCHLLHWLCPCSMTQHGLIHTGL